MQDIFQYDKEQILTIDKWKNKIPNLRAGFTTRNGGVSEEPFSTNNLGLHVSDREQDVIANRNRLAGLLDIPLEKWVAGEQTHHQSIYVVRTTDAGKGAKTVDSSLTGIDGLITNDKEILLTAFFADCVPLFFIDPVTEYIGIAHAGWKGTVGRIAEEMTKNFIELGTNLNDLMVVIGPCISHDNYEVDEYVKGRVPKEFQEKVLSPLGNQHYLLDLKQLNVEILVQSGVFRSNIEVTNYCTYRDKSLFFSHRRDNGKTGRMLGFIGFSR